MYANFRKFIVNFQLHFNSKTFAVDRVFNSPSMRPHIKLFYLKKLVSAARLGLKCGTHIFV
jgi:hypothetical protein